MGWPAFRVGRGPFGFDAFSSRTGFYYLVLIALTAAFAFCRALVRSPFGAVLRGIRENEAKTLALGYNTRLYKIAVVALAYALGGLAGALYAPFAGFANTELVVLAVFRPGPDHGHCRRFGHLDRPDPRRRVSFWSSSTSSATTPRPGRCFSV